MWLTLSSSLPRAVSVTYSSLSQLLTAFHWNVVLFESNSKETQADRQTRLKVVTRDVGPLCPYSQGQIQGLRRTRTSPSKAVRCSVALDLCCLKESHSPMSLRAVIVAADLSPCRQYHRRREMISVSQERPLHPLLSRRAAQKA